MRLAIEPASHPSTADVNRKLPLFLIPISCALLRADLAETERKITKLAEGVYSIQHKVNGGNVEGNTTVVIGDRQVLVVDSCYLPASAREDIAQIRQWTNKPVA